MPCTVPLISVCLLLSGNRWHIHAGDADAARVVAAFGEAMSLSPTNLATKQGPDEQLQELHVLVDPGLSESTPDGCGSGPASCLIPPPDNHDLLVIGMLLISQAIARAEFPRGGLLVHGALAEAPGRLEGAIILAGPSTVGKTTASKRLPLPWRALSDDTSLVVRNASGQYMAHPWPTWSRYYTNPDGRPGPGGKCDIQAGLPLQAIFFLEQAEDDQVTPLPTSSAIAYLMQTVQHVSLPMPDNLSADQDQTLYRNQLAAAEILVHTIPAYTLRLSLTGAFWDLIEKTLALSVSASSSQPGNIPSPWYGQKNEKNTSLSFLPGEDCLTVNYSGSSMHPTLRQPDLVEVVPFADRPVRRGDVVYYRCPTGGPRVIHRVVRVTPDCIYTRGDNNCENDPYLIRPSDIIGQVTAAWSHNRRRKITGGPRGIWSGFCAGNYIRFNKIFSPILHRVYHGLAACGFLRLILPASYQPRVYEFMQRYQPAILKLMVNGKVIGRYDVWQKLWVIDRPWRLFIDTSKLPVVRWSPPDDSTDLGAAVLNNTVFEN